MFSAQFTTPVLDTRGSGEQPKGRQVDCPSPAGGNAIPFIFLTKKYRIFSSLVWGRFASLKDLVIGNTTAANLSSLILTILKIKMKNQMLSLEGKLAFRIRNLSPMKLFAGSF